MADFSVLPSIDALLQRPGVRVLVARYGRDATVTALRASVAARRTTACRSRTGRARSRRPRRRPRARRRRPARRRRAGHAAPGGERHRRRDPHQPRAGAAGRAPRWPAPPPSAAVMRRSSTTCRPAGAARARCTPSACSPRSPAPRRRSSSTTTPPPCCWRWRGWPRAARSWCRAANWSRSAAASAFPTCWRSRARRCARSAPPTAPGWRTSPPPPVRPTALWLRVHPSNFRIEGFTERPALAPLVAAAHAAGVAVVEDLGSGNVDPGLDWEPTVQDSVAAGVDVVCVSGDKLLGGPQAGLIIGRAAPGRSAAPPSADARAAGRQADLRRARSDAGRALERPRRRDGAGAADAARAARAASSPGRGAGGGAGGARLAGVGRSTASRRWAAAAPPASSCRARWCGWPGRAGVRRASTPGCAPRRRQSSPASSTAPSSWICARWTAPWTSRSSRCLRGTCSGLTDRVRRRRPRTRPRVYTVGAEAVPVLDPMPPSSAAPAAVVAPRQRALIGRQPRPTRWERRAQMRPGGAGRGARDGQPVALPGDQRLGRGHVPRDGGQHRQVR